MPVARAWDRWTAFLLSLCVPGAGQVWAGSGWSAAWFAGLFAVAFLPPPLGVLGFLPLALASARHAQRCLSGPARGDDPVTVTLLDWRVDLHASIVLPYTPAYVWTFVSDLPRFGRVDPFHDAIHVDGRSLVIDHCAFGYRFARVGRLLHWHEGKGYAFSDLSARGPRTGFPHVFFITVDAEGDGARLSIRVRGKWTERFLPRWFVRRWLRYVAREHARLVRSAFGMR